MTSLSKKIINGRPYYYARECKRVNGKPKIVWQKYLGSAEDIVRRCEEQKPGAVIMPDEVSSIEFGASAALWDLVRRTKIVEFIDKHVPQNEQAISIGLYMAIAAVNRCIAPCSKSKIGEWFQGTILRKIVDIEGGQLSSQRFWNKMDVITPEAIKQVEKDITHHMVREFDIDLQRVLFDDTNFFTFIDSFNERASLAQRGKSKEGRKSLRLVGLALLVSADSHVPLFHQTVPGNQHAAKTFKNVIPELIQRYKDVSKGIEHVTIVFDKGNNSKENLSALKELESPYHFVGSLVPTQHEDLLKITSRHFRSLDSDGLTGVKSHRVTKNVFGVERTVIIAFNQELFDTQTKTLKREIKKQTKQLIDLQGRLQKRQAGSMKGISPTSQGVESQVGDILKGRHMKALFTVKINEKCGHPVLSYRFNDSEWSRLQKTLLGKTIIFTDNADWSDAEIINTYRAQHHIEAAFRLAKSPYCVSIRPQYHWTDQKIEVHVFYCVLAITICSLLQRELKKKGIQQSIDSILEDLKKMDEITMLFPPTQAGQEPQMKQKLSKMSPRQQLLFDALDLQRFVS